MFVCLFNIFDVDDRYKSWLTLTWSRLFKWRHDNADVSCKHSLYCFYWPLSQSNAHIHTWGGIISKVHNISYVAFNGRNGHWKSVLGEAKLKSNCNVLLCLFVCLLVCLFVCFLAWCLVCLFYFIAFLFVSLLVF